MPASRSGKTRQRYTDLELARAVRRVDREAKKLGRSGATARAYSELKRDDEPALRTVILRFGTWNVARRAAGLSPLSRRYEPSGARERALEALAACARDLGHAPSISEYVRWRVNRALDDGTYRTPSEATVRGFAVGGWERFVREAMRPSLRDVPTPDTAESVNADVER